jgi:hypothetical protein
MANTFMFPAAAAASEEGFIAFKYILSAAWVDEWQVSSHSSWTYAACVEFCKINFIPAATLVYASASVGAWDTPVWAALTAGYAYFGYVA